MPGAEKPVQLVTTRWVTSRTLQRVWPEIQRPLHRVEHRAPAGMHRPDVDRLDVEALQHGVAVIAQHVLDRVGHLAG